MTARMGFEPHVVQRVRHETRRRTVTVVDVVNLTPNMRRVVFNSADLADFVSLGADDHVKLIVPDGAGGTVMRDYTPRAYDNAEALLTIDFALHDAGLATAWAMQAKVGDKLEIGGPRGSRIVPDDFDWYLLIGDETGLPAIGRRLQELRAAVPVTTLVVVDDMAEAQQIATAAAWTPHWVCRGRNPPRDDELLRVKLREIAPPAGDGYVWIAAEASVAQALRAYFMEAWSQNPRWMRAAGYWRKGQVGTHENFD
jgi:NADPH-dependent ferric siderophore reductase